ncbi:MAG: MFS transporter [Candidatus Thorarchaeota archaeon]
MFISKIFESYSGIPKEVKYLVYASIMPSVAYGMLYTDLSYFLTAVQGISAGFMGLVITLMGISTFSASILFGILADVYGRKRLLVAGNILASIIIAVFALSTNPAVLIIAAILEGFSEAAILASSSALLAEKVENNKRTSVFSFYGFAQNIAYGLGSLAISFIIILESLGFNNKDSHIILYILISVTSLTSALFMLRVKESKCLKKLGGNIWDLLPRKSKGALTKYVLTGGIIAFGAGMVVPLMTFWFNLRYGISDSISASILAFSGILIGLAILVAPILAKKFGLINAIVITQITSMIFMFATPFSSNFILAGVVYSFRALLMNISNPLSQSLIMGLVPKEERGTVSGISGALWRLPNALSSFIGAFLMGLGLLFEPFFIGGLFYILSIILFWFFFRTTKMPEEQI